MKNLAGYHCHYADAAFASRSEKLEHLHEQIKDAYNAGHYGILKDHVTAVYFLREHEASIKSEETVALSDLMVQLSSSLPDGVYITLYLARYFTHKDNAFAGRLFRRAAAATISLLGDSNPAAAHRIIDLAGFYMEVKDEALAIETFETGVLLLQRHNPAGINNLDIPEAQLHLADMYLLQGDYKRYENTLENIIEWCVKLEVSNDLCAGKLKRVKDLLSRAKFKLTGSYELLAEREL